MFHSARILQSLAVTFALSGCCFDCSYNLAKAEYYLRPNAFYSNGTPVHEIEVHADTLNRYGGNTRTPQFENYFSGILKEKDLCPSGWKRHTSGRGAALGYGTSYSAVMTFECI